MGNRTPRSLSTASACDAASGSLRMAAGGGDRPLVDDDCVIIGRSSDADDVINCNNRWSDRVEVVLEERISDVRGIFLVDDPGLARPLLVLFCNCVTGCSEPVWCLVCEDSEDSNNCEAAVIAVPLGSSDDDVNGDRPPKDAFSVEDAVARFAAEILSDRASKLVCRPDDTEPIANPAVGTTFVFADISGSCCVLAPLV